MLKRIFLSILVIGLCLSGMAQVKIINPVKIHPTAFAIIIDRATYDHLKSDVEAYKQMLEQKEQLSTYIVVNNWQTPEEVQNAIRSLVARKPVLEGAVFVGRIPVVLIRNAQHMTTSFKMDEIKYPFDQSSIASDRFYDDFDLRFRFLKKDDKKKDWFYYELDESCPQAIRSDIYTARIMSQKEGDLQYKEIGAFLRKAVAARNKPNPLDHLMAFTGSAYNSESLTAWTDEQTALKELFPQTFKMAQTARMLNFRMDPQMKFQLFSELQRPELDLALLTEHGDVSKQYINNAASGNDFDFSYNFLRFAARTALRKGIQKGQDSNKIKSSYKEKYKLDDHWFEGALTNDSLRLADSLLTADADIFVSDIQKFTPQSRVIIFNACYNGSFHQPENISAAYIFNPGNTLVVQGNTVNVLQDKWAIEQMGLLNHGVRVGLWAYQINTLESHLSGDPTWRFTASSSDLNQKIVLDRNKISSWKLLLANNDPVLQSLALKQLFNAEMPGIGGLLLKTFKNSPFANVRMQCLALLSRIGNADYHNVIPLALQDPYELIRRKASEWTAKSGDDDFIPMLISLALQRPNDERVIYNIRKSLEQMNAGKVKAEIERQVNAAGYIFNKEAFLKQWLNELQRRSDNAVATLAMIKDKQKNEQERILAIRLIRNNTYHEYVPDFLQVAEDNTESEDIRKNMIEALGWFSTSYQKDKIIDACKRIQKKTIGNSVINREAIQTVLRLQKWSLQ